MIDQTIEKTENPTIENKELSLDDMWSTLKPDVIDQKDQNEITNIGTIEYLYEGSGGINQAYIGFGFKPFSWMNAEFGDAHRFLLQIQVVQQFGYRWNEGNDALRWICQPGLLEKHALS